MENWLPTLPAEPAFFISVQSGTTPPQRVQVYSSDTYQDVVRRLVPEEQNHSVHYLTVNGAPLDCSARVDRREETFVLHSGIAVGAPAPQMGSFNPLDFASVRDLVPVRPDPVGDSWRMIRPGMSIRSRCKKEGCPAFGKMIYVTSGFGKFDIAKSMMTVKCPECKNRAEKGQNIGFLQAQFEVFGITADEQEQTFPARRAVGRDYLTFSDSERTQWLCLEVTVSPLD